MTGINDGITEAKEAEEAIRKSEAQYRLLTENMKDVIWILDAETLRFRYVSPSVERLRGYTTDEVMSVPMDEALVPEARQAVRDLIHQRAADLLSGKAPSDKFYTEDVQQPCKDGSFVWTEVITSFYLNPESNRVEVRGATRDISERKRAEDAFQREQYLNKVLMDTLPDAIYFKDLQNRFMRINQAQAKNLGINDPEQAMGKTDFDFFSAELAQPAARDEQEIIQTGKPLLNYEELLTYPDRPSEWVLVTKMPLRDQAGEIIGTFGLSRKINDIKLNEEKLRESEQSFRAFFEQTGVGVAQVESKTGKYIKLNQKHCDILGYSQEEMLAQTFQSITYPDDLQSDLGLMGRLFAGEIDQFSIEKRFYRKDGSIVWVNLTVSPMWSKGEEQIYHIAVIQDITERKQIAEELLRSRQMLQLIFDNIPQRVFWKDHDSIFQGCNQPFADDYHLADPADIVGKKDFDLVKKENAELFRADDRQVMDSDTAKLNYEEQQHHPDGTTYWLKTNKIPLHDQDGKVIGVLGTYEDITERKRTQELVEHQQEELLRSNQELEQFAYVASHDLQEPLRMVSSYMQLLERRYKGRLDQDADEFIGFAVDGATRMQRLISDLLMYSRVGTRAKPHELVPGDEIIAQALDNLSMALEESKALVTHDLLPTILVDKTQMIQLFQNLIGNAIKFHGQKAPHVHISAEQSENEWVFSVKDNGIGFDPQYAERIFVIFQRLNERSEYSGTGIGLAICKKIVERHGGHIWVDTKIGEGSTFHFSIPENAAAS